MLILEWIIWTIGLLVFVCFLYGMRTDAKNHRLIHIATLIQIILLFLTAIGFLYLRVSKFHLIWVVPSCFILGWILGFVILPIPIVGDILRNLSLIFAHVFLVGTDWEIGGFPWEISTLRALKARIPQEQYRTMDDFEAAIKEHEGQLLGISLYNEGIQYLYAHDKDVLATTDYHFREIMERGEKAISQAKELLEQVKNGAENIDVLKKFEFPPIHGPGLDEMSERATLLVQVYEKMFPLRPRNIPLTTEENEKMMEELAKIL